MPNPSPNPPPTPPPIPSTRPARPPQPPGPSRRKRRQAERAQHHQTATKPAAGRATAKPATGRQVQPLILATVAAIVIGVAFIGILVLQSKPAATTGPIVSPAIVTPTSLAHGLMLGSPDAPAKMEVYSDFQCPNCLVFWTQIEPGIVSADVATGKAELIYHDFPFIGEESQAAAIAARCADQQGKFWPFHDYLFANQGEENSGAFTEPRLAQIASDVGLDTTTWTTCLGDTTILNDIEADQTSGETRGVNGTPTIFVNNTKLASYDPNTIQAAIDAVLATATPAPLTTVTSPSASPTSAPPSSSVGASPTGAPPGASSAATPLPTSALGTVPPASAATSGASASP